MSVRVGVDIKGNNRDLLGSIAGSKAALADLRGESAKMRAESIAQQRELRNINNELRRQSQALRGVALDYVGVRRAVLSFSTRSAIVGVNELTAAVTDAATGITDLGFSVANFGAAAGTGIAGYVAAVVQGTQVGKLALAGLGDAITSTGKAHEQALSKLTKPQREFVKQTGELREAYRQVQLVAQQGLLPGLTEAVKSIDGSVLPMLRTNIFDTGQMLGYLAERGVGMLNSRVGEVDALMKRNIITIEKGGRTVENFAAGVLDGFNQVDPLIAHITSGVEDFSKSFKNAMGSDRGQAELSKVIENLQESWDNWTGTIGSAGTALYNIWSATQPVVHQVENAIENVADKAAIWTGTHQDDIYNYFEGGLKPLGEFAKLVGDTVKLFGGLGADHQDELASVFKDIRTEVLPVVKDIADIFGDDLAPHVGQLLLDIVHIVDVSLPGFKAMADGLHPVAELLHIILDDAAHIIDTFNDLGPVGAAIGTLAVGTTVVATWKALRREIQLTMQAASYKLGISQVRPSGAAFVQALPGDRVVARAFGRNRTTEYNPYLTSAPAAVTSAPRQRYNVTTTGGAPTGRNRPRTPYSPYTSFNGRTNRVFAPMPEEGIGRVTKVTQGSINPLTGFYQTPSKGGKLNTVERVEDGYGTRARRADGSFIGGFTKGVKIDSTAARQAVRDLAQYTSKVITPGIRDNVVDGFRAAGKKVKSMGPEVKSMTKGVGMGLATTFGLAYVLDKNTRKSVNAQFTDNTMGATGLPKTGITDSIAKLPVISQVKGAASFLGLTDKSKEAKDRAQALGSELDKLYQKASKLNDVNALKKIAEQARDGASKFPQYRDAFQKFADSIDFSTGVSSSNKLEFALAETAKMGGSSLGDIIRRTKQTGSVIRSELSAGSLEAKQQLSKNFNLAVGAIKESMDAGVIATKEGMHEIRTLFYQNMREWGFSVSAAHHYANSKTGDTSGKGSAGSSGSGQGAARGTMFRLPGAVGPDSIPMNINGKQIIAAPGEDVAIINRHQRAFLDERTSDIGGLGGVFRTITTPHNYAKGGWVTGDTDYKPSLGSALERMAAAKHTPIYVQEGGRTLAEQQARWNAYMAGGNEAARPTPNAPHVRGIAADITPGRGVFGSIAQQFGLGFTVPSEDWHVQLLGAAADAVGGVGGGSGPTSIKKVIADGVSGQLGQIVQGALDGAQGAVNSVLSSLGTSSASGADGIAPGGKKSAGGQYTKGMLADLWVKAGGDPSVKNLMAAIALAESAGNPDIVNSIGATGLWQIHPGGSQYLDPLTNARTAVEKYQTQGLAAWEAYTNGSYKTFMARGGIIHALGGMLGYTVKPPTTGVDPGAPDTSDAVTKKHGGSDSSSSKKKKKKNTRDIVGGRPKLGAGIGRSRFKPASRKPKPIRKSIKKLLENNFKHNEFSSKDLFDPFTGEQLDLGDVYPGVFNLDAGGDFIQQLQDQLGIAQSNADMTEEQFLVTMMDTDQHKDLTNYLLSIGETDPEAWKNKYGDSYELVNDVPGGRTVQGKQVRGIKEYVDEISNLLTFHQSRYASPVQQLMGGGIRGLMEWQQNYASTIPADEAIQERRAKLAKIKAATEATIELRKAQFRKMSKMGQKGYTWKEAVEHNKDIITKWQNWKRDSYGESHGESRQANSEIDRLKDENKKLSHDKPKGRVFGDAAYANEYRMYQRSRTELNKLVGDPSVQSWSPQAGTDSGVAGDVLLTLNEWKDIKSYKEDLLGNLRSAIPQEDQTIAELQKSIKDATGTVAAIPQMNDDGDKQKQDTLNALNNQLNADRIVDAIARQTNFSALSGAAGMVRGRYVGAFAQGGLVPETGMALVHKGEFINPAPDGAYRNGTNSAPALSVGGNSTEIHLHGELATLLRIVDARIDERAAGVTSSQLGRRQKVIRAAPGR